MFSIFTWQTVRLHGFIQAHVSLVSHLQERGDGAVATHSRGGATVPHHTAKVMILPSFGLDGMYSMLCEGHICCIGGLDSVGRLFQGQMLCK